VIEQADRDIPEGGHDLRAVSGISGICVFGPGGVAVSSVPLTAVTGACETFMAAFRSGLIWLRHL